MIYHLKVYYESVYDENSNFQPEKLKLNDHQNATSSYSYGMTGLSATSERVKTNPLIGFYGVDLVGKHIYFFDFRSF